MKIWGPFHSSIASGNSRTGYQINFNNLPSASQAVRTKRIDIVTTVDPEEEGK